MLISDARLENLLESAEVVVDEFFAFYEHDRPEITNSTIEAMRRLRNAAAAAKSELPEQLPPHTRECDWCGEFAFCNVYQAGREPETGYVDVQTLCPDCSQIFEDELYDRREGSARARGIRGHDDH